MNGYKRIVLAVSGMKDNRCRECVAEVLGQMEGVLQAEVSLIRARAVVDCVSQCDASAFICMLESVGYQAVVEDQ